MCDSSRFDALVLATPAETHYKLAAAALKSGLDVLVEKPLALSTQEAFQLARLSEESGCILMVGHTYEFNPAVERMVVFDDMSADARLRVFDKKAVPSEEPSAYGLYHTKLHAGDILIPKLPLLEALAAECEHFLHCVQTRDIPRSDAFSGARTVQVCRGSHRLHRPGGNPD